MSLPACAGDTGPAGPAGAAGTDGDSGAGSLVRLDDEAAGANCAHGGVAVHAGVDDDGNGTLEDAEIDSTEYVCGNSTIGACTEIEGDVYINNTLDLATFKLHGCTSIVSGGLYIVETQLSSLAGLETLTSVEDYVHIEGNSSLVNLAGLANLEEASGVFIINNDSLTSASLPALADAGDTLEISGNSALTSVDAPLLDGPEGLLITENAALTTLPAFTSLTLVGELNISGNASLTAVTGFPALQTVAFSMIIAENEQLATVGGFPALTTVGSDLVMSNLPALTTVSGFDALTSVGNNLSFYNDAALTSITGFGALATVGDELFIGWDLFDNAPPTATVTTIPTFPALTEVGGLVLSNLAITSLAGFTALTETTGVWPTGGWLYLFHLNNLTDIAGFTAVTQTGSDLAFFGNANLAAISGFTALTTVGYDFQIENNPMFPECEATAWADTLSIANTTYISDNDTTAVCP